MVSDLNAPAVTVVILNWNGAHFIRRYLDAVYQNTNPQIADILIVDNGSTDNSVEIFEKEYPMLRLLKFEENYGFAGGYNRAIASVKTPYVVLLNSDVKPGEKWIEPLYDFMVAHPGVGACQPKIRSEKDEKMFEYAGACGGFIDRNGYTYCRGRIFDTSEEDNGQYNDLIPVFWATGAALMVRTDLYMKVGGLDERFFAHMEEIDLCWRILLAGYDVYAVPDSVIFHLGGGSLPVTNPKKTYLNFRNNLLMLHKNLPDSTRRKKLFRRRLLDTIAWAKFVASADFKNAKAVWRAHRDFAKMSGLYTEHPDVDLLDLRSDTRRNILIDYFLRRRRVFSSLK